MKEVPAPAPRYTVFHNGVQFEVPPGSGLGKELKAFFRPTYHKALSTLAEGWESLTIGDPLGTATAVELAKYHFPDIVHYVPTEAQSGPSTEAVAALERESMAERTRQWYVDSGIPLPDESEPGF